MLQASSLFYGNYYVLQWMNDTELQGGIYVYTAKAVVFPNKAAVRAGIEFKMETVANETGGWFGERTTNFLDCFEFKNIMDGSRVVAFVNSDGFLVLPSTRTHTPDYRTEFGDVTSGTLTSSTSDRGA
jgi:hypothetical protein